MISGRLLDRLEAVRQTAPNQWLARCPAHADKHPSLSIKELPSGTVVMYCHAQCETADILAALGLTWAALYPDRGTPQKRRTGASWAELGAILKQESTIAALAASDVAQRKPISDEDADRCALAAGRIRQAADAMRGAA